MTPIGHFPRTLLALQSLKKLSLSNFRTAKGSISRFDPLFFHSSRRLEWSKGKSRRLQHGQSTTKHYQKTAFPMKMPYAPSHNGIIIAPSSYIWNVFNLSCVLQNCQLGSSINLFFSTTTSRIWELHQLMFFIQGPGTEIRIRAACNLPRDSAQTY